MTRAKVRSFFLAVGLVMALVLASSATAAAASTGSVTCNGVSLSDYQTAQVATLHPGDQVSCSFSAQAPKVRFFFMVGRGFSPLFAHSANSTFTAGGPDGFASITVYWVAPGQGSVTATFPYQIVKAS